MPLHLDLDPGRAGFGWCLRDGVRVLNAGVVVPPAAPRDFARASAAEVAQNAFDRISGFLWGLPGDVDTVGVEYMVHYPPRGGKGKKFSEKARTAIANDLLELQAIGGLVAASFVRPGKVEYFTPAQWKGSTDTAVIEARLNEWGGWLHGELEVWARVQSLGKTLRHNAVDALAMGLVRTKRFRLT